MARTESGEVGLGWRVIEAPRPIVALENGSPCVPRGGFDGNRGASLLTPIGHFTVFVMKRYFAGNLVFSDRPCCVNLRP